MRICSFLTVLLLSGYLMTAQQTQKPPLHAKNWMAITGKPLAATAGAITFQKGGNAVDQQELRLNFSNQKAIIFLLNLGHWPPPLRVHPAVFVICWPNMERSL